MNNILISNYNGDIWKAVFVQKSWTKQKQYKGGILVNLLNV